MKGTGMCTDRAHCSPNFLTLALQYPKGIFSTKTVIVTIIKFKIMRQNYKNNFVQIHNASFLLFIRIN